MNLCVLTPRLPPHPDLAHTEGPLDGSLYARIRKRDSLVDAVASLAGLQPPHPAAATITSTSPQTLPVTAPPSSALPAVDHTLSVSSDSGNSTASVKTDRTDSQAHPQLSPPHPLLSSLGDPATSASHRQRHQDYLATSSTSPGGGGGGGGVRHLVPAQVHVNGGLVRLLAAPAPPSAEQQDTRLPEEEEEEEEQRSSLGTLSSLEGLLDEHTGAAQDDGPYLERSARGQEEALREMPVHGARTPTAVTMDSSCSSPVGGYHNGGGGGSPYLDPRLMPRAPERSTSSREAVQRGLTSWHQHSLPDDPFGPPLQNTHSLPLIPASQRDIQQSIEALNTLMLDLEQAPAPPLVPPPHPRLPKSCSAPSDHAGYFGSLGHDGQGLDLCGGRVSASPVADGPSPASRPYHPHTTTTPEPHLLPLLLHNTPGPVHHPVLKPANADPSVSQSPDPPQSSSPYPGYSISSSPVPALTPQPRDVCYSSPPPPPREQEVQEENLNLEGLVAHRIAGKGPGGYHDTTGIRREGGRTLLWFGCLTPNRKVLGSIPIVCSLTCSIL